MADEALTGALDFLQALDDRTENKFNELARDLTNNLFVLLRSAGLYDLNNEAMARPYYQMSQTVEQFLEIFNEELALQLVDGNFFVNMRQIPLDFATYDNVRYLRRIFEFLDVHEMRFVKPVDTAILIRFLQAFLAVVREQKGSINDYDISPIRMRKLGATQYDELRRDDDPRARVLGLYASGLLMLRQFVNDLRKGRSPRHAKVKRLCLELIDIEPRHHAMLLALIQLEAYKGNLFCHMLNTAVLSLVFGQRLGLNKTQLVDLGMAAFNHDLGWALMGTFDRRLGDEEEVALSMEGINDVREDGQINLDEVRVNVARSLVRIGGFNELVINRLIVAYECQVPEDKPPEGLYYGDIGASFMTQVVRMASTFDELTTPKKGRQALMPDKAMKRILDDGGKTYDVFWAKLFVNCIGVYPVGTLVELDTTEVGLVVNLPSNPINFHRPQVKVLIDRMGQPQQDGPIVDLDATYKGGGKYMRTIERTLESRAYGVSITRFFFG